MGERGKDTVIVLEEFPFICRICCFRRNDLRLFEEEEKLLHLFITIRNIDVGTLSHFPRNICNECVNKLLDISKFVDGMKNNESKLRERENECAELVGNGHSCGGRENTDKEEKMCATCRLCSCADGLTPFREKESLAQVFQTVANINEESAIKIACGDLICNSCFDKLEAILSFNNMSRCNEKMLEHIISKKKFTNTSITSDSIGADSFNAGDLASETSADGAEQIIDGKKNDLSISNNATASMVEWTKETCDVDIKEGIIDNYCEEGDSIFHAGDEKKVHSLSHIDKKSFKCGQCAKMFSRKSHLARHMLSHTGEKPYKCGHCGEGFGYKEKLQNHMFQHTGEKPYKCGHCEKAFTQKSYLLQHMFIHSEKWPYKCDPCNKNFNRRDRFERHLRTHDKTK